MMSLEDLGYNSNFDKYRIDNNLNSFDVGRIISEHKERYTIKTDKGEYDAEITGNIRFTAKDREDFPAVGDWVAFTHCDSEFAIINNVFPRFSTISRQAVGQFGKIQILATNIDYAFLIQAVDRDFNITRLERYLTLCNASNVTPIIILSKIDLIDTIRMSEILESINVRIKNIPVITLSNESQEGYDALKTIIEKGKTYCLLGSSGVGKSTLINNLSQKPIMRTDTISQSTNKGRHVTSHRELIIIESGGILIDNPGMREVGITDATSGLEITFDMIVHLSQNCAFRDCTHTTEIGCSVLESVNKGELDKVSYKNYLKMEKEKAHFESSIADRRKKDKKFGKFVKNYKKEMNKIKY